MCHILSETLRESKRLQYGGGDRIREFIINKDECYGISRALPASWHLLLKRQQSRE